MTTNKELYKDIEDARIEYVGVENLWIKFLEQQDEIKKLNKKLEKKRTIIDLMLEEEKDMEIKCDELAEELNRVCDDRDEWIEENERYEQNEKEKNKKISELEMINEAYRKTISQMFNSNQ